MTTSQPLASVPKWLILGFTLTLLLQVAVNQQRGQKDRPIKPIPPAPDKHLMTALSFGNPAWTSRLLSLWLQNQDYQRGTSLALDRLNYVTVEDWLSLQLSLDPHSRYPMMAAMHYYGEVTNQAKIRRMIQFVEKKFTENPMYYWRWMADAVVKARHKLQDNKYAYELAEQLAKATYDLPVPSWVQQIHIFLMEDMGEEKSAALLLGALLSSGAIIREEEINFLQHRLNKMHTKIDEKSSN